MIRAPITVPSVAVATRAANRIHIWWAVNQSGANTAGSLPRMSNDVNVAFTHDLAKMASQENIVPMRAHETRNSGERTTVITWTTLKVLGCHVTTAWAPTWPSTWTEATGSRVWNPGWELRPVNAASRIPRAASYVAPPENAADVTAKVTSFRTDESKTSRRSPPTDTFAAALHPGGTSSRDIQPEAAGG